MKLADMISVPTRGTDTVDRKTGQILDRCFQYASLPAAAVAEFFCTRFGLDAALVELSDDPEQEGDHGE